MKNINNSNDNLSIPTWWFDLVSCPVCGEGNLFNRLDNNITENGHCIQCDRPWIRNKQILQWPKQVIEKNKKRDGFFYLNAIKFYIDPLASPFSPLSVMTKIRGESYYNRTINDKELAKTWYKHYLRGIELPKETIVLDHGCGRGRNVALLNQLGFNVVGQEISVNPWWENLLNNGFQVVEPNFSRLPWRECVFDILLNVMVLHHFTKEQLKEHVREVMRVLRPGGYWLILEANSTSYGAHAPRKHYGRLHSLHSVRSLAKDAGFMEVNYWYEGFYSPIFPRLFNFIRKQCSPRPLDIYDYNSWIEKYIPPDRRGLWFLRLQRPVDKN